MRSCDVPTSFGWNVSAWENSRYYFTSRFHIHRDKETIVDPKRCSIRGSRRTSTRVGAGVSLYTEGVPLVSCHRMLEPGSSCHFFSLIFLFGQSDFQVSKTIFDSREILFFELLLLFWSSCYFLELLLGSSIWWRELGETPSVYS